MSPNNDDAPNLLNELAAAMRAGADDAAGLIQEPREVVDQGNLEQQISQSLHQAETGVLGFSQSQSDRDAQESWSRARQLVANFKPVPWFIWRVSNAVLGKPGKISALNDGLIFGMRRLLFAVASDVTFGSGQKVNSVPEGLKIVAGDVFAASAVIHAICRRLQQAPFERIWRPLLDDAITRAKIGYYIGKHHPNFGAGRGMLAGFSGRVGLILQLASGDGAQATQALERLAAGAAIKSIGEQLYRCDPLQVSAMLLSGVGVGIDAAFGVVSYAAEGRSLAQNEEQQRWLTAFSLIELLRNSKEISSNIDPTLLNLTPAQIAELKPIVQKLVRAGHELNWIL